MGYTVRVIDTSNLVLNETDEVASILQNVAVILSTYKGDVPQYRDFGISAEIMHRPVNVAKALLLAEISETIGKYEPRAKVKSVDFETDKEHPDRLNPIVEVELNE